MIRNTDFLGLPILELTKQGGLVIVWATNKQSQHDFIREELFGRWKVAFLTQWIWLKVYVSG